MTTRTSRLQVATSEFGHVDEPAGLLDHLGADGCAFIRPDGQGFVTSGVAARLDPHDAAAAVAAIGSGAIAVGALPFTGTGSLTIPARIVRRAVDGTLTLTDLGPADRLEAGPRPATRVGRVPRRFAVEARQDLSSWDATVAAALGAIDDGTLRKVVIAREVEVDADTPFEVASVLARLLATQPGCYVYADRGFVGASPELLVERFGAVARSRPMAGTTARRASVAADDRAVAELLDSRKDDVEHALVVEAVRAGFAEHCDTIEVSDPVVERFATVSHLTTTITGRVIDGAGALTLALALHPTPAVGGSPRARALRAIDAFEPFDRGQYAGPVGWIDEHGDGEWAVALRCATLDGSRARLLAGAGIVDGSDPDAEWAETQAKLEPMLRALVRP